jgi:hypothetical protein
MSKSVLKKFPCPACNGSGELKPPKPKKGKSDADGKLSHAAKALRDAGYTIREIANILCYDHPGSISHLLSKKN